MPRGRLTNTGRWRSYDGGIREPDKSGARENKDYFESSGNVNVLPPPFLMSALSVVLVLYLAGINSLAR